LKGKGVISGKGESWGENREKGSQRELRDVGPASSWFVRKEAWVLGGEGREKLSTGQGEEGALKSLTNWRQERA